LIEVIDVDASVGQAGAVRLGISRALTEFNPLYKQALKAGMFSLNIIFFLANFQICDIVPN
jgi:hypothetical protein